MSYRALIWSDRQRESIVQIHRTLTVQKPNSTAKLCQSQDYFTGARHTLESDKKYNMVEHSGLMTETVIFRNGRLLIQ